MNVAFKPRMKLEQAKKLLKTIKNESGSVKRSGASGTATVRTHRGFTCTLIFQSNLELRKLV